ncbi:MAG: endonuclease III [Chloroflexi bacterium]|nr:endonuclease III [Chloroflexota bacterium]
MVKRNPADEKKRVQAILRRLRKAYPDAQCALNHRSAFELLVATILSAQCTDATVNKVTPALFAHCPTPAALAAAPRADVEALVRSTGFFRNKARNIQGAAHVLVEEFGGEVPQGMDDLLSLPGVARKTANVVRGVCFGLADGVVVDTHVRRISQRLGLTKQEDPVKIEQDLMTVLPKTRWIAFSHEVIWHGRRICDARKPLCEQCSLFDLCPSGTKLLKARR